MDYNVEKANDEFAATMRAAGASWDHMIAKLAEFPTSELIGSYFEAPQRATCPESFAFYCNALVFAIRQRTDADAEKFVADMRAFNEKFNAHEKQKRESMN